MVYYSVHRFLNTAPISVDHLESEVSAAAGWISLGVGGGDGGFGGGGSRGSGGGTRF